ncbi:MAG TPA: family 1 glycosylhydrolase, partial [Ginsengibacter sp.]
MLLKKEDFGNDFTWGVATAAYQVEGSCDVHSKGKSIWDV